MREIPKKNYIIFAFVIVVSIGIILYCMRWYTMSQSVDKSNVMDGVVSELKSDELSSYLLDNPNVIVYLAPSDSDENKSLEDELQNLIVSKNLTNEFIYLDSISYLHIFSYQYHISKNKCINQRIKIDTIRDMVLKETNRGYQLLIYTNDNQILDGGIYHEKYYTLLSQLKDRIEQEKEVLLSKPEIVFGKKEEDNPSENL